jgi:uncharacterized membrane protein
MANDRFSKKEAIKFGWEAMKNNLVFFILFLLVAWIISGGISFLGNPRWGPDFLFFPIFFSVLGWVISIFISMAYTKIGLRLSAAAGETAVVEDTWSAYPYFLNYLVGSILYGLIVLGGLILLIVPGIIWGIKYSMFGYLIIDRDMGPVEALKKSGEITRGYKWELFLLGLLFIGISILGALACGVGLFAAIPTILVAHVYVYRRLAYGVSTEQAAPVVQAQEAAQPPEA